MRTERYFKVPLCKKDCDNWFDACKNDFTCRDNWSYGFLWREGDFIKVALCTILFNSICSLFFKGINYCRPEDKCITIKEMYETAENFCRTIWDDSFVIEADEKKCFTFDFTGDNPNKVAAQFYTKN